MYSAHILFKAEKFTANIITYLNLQVEEGHGGAMYSSIIILQVVATLQKVYIICCNLQHRW